MTNTKSNYAESSKGAWLLIALAVYLVRVMPWACSEYWYDEVITLGDYVISRPEYGIWNSVFRSYPVANNHILSSAVYWCWVRVLNFGIVAEQLVRLPSILFGGGLIAIVVCHWRKWLGDRIANLGGLALAISPVFTAYAYQIRGYSLSMLLAGAALSGILEYTDGNKKPGQLLLCASCILLPLVIPSNMLFVPVLLITLAFACPVWKSCLQAVIPPMLCAALGTSYYFTIWEQFIKASKEPAGWDSAWLVAGNLTLALASFGIVLLAASLAAWKINKKQNGQDEPSLSQPVLKLNPLVLTCSCIGIIALTLICARSGQAPYPRVFLIFLPAATLCILMFAVKTKAFKLSYPLLAVAILLNGLVWERTAGAITDSEVKRGQSPNNLLQQYYRGADDLRTAAAFLRDEKWMANGVVITDEYDFPTMNLYWRMNGGQQGMVTTVNFSPIYPQNFWHRRHDPRLALWVVAKTPESAARLLEYAGFGPADILKENFGKPGGMTLIAPCGRRGIYSPPMPKPPVPRKHPIPNTTLI